MLWHLPRKWKKCIWINVAKIFTRNHNSTPYKHLSLQPAKAKVSQKYSWKRQQWWGGGWWGYKQIALVWLMTPSYSVPVNPPSPFPISGKPFSPIIVENFWLHLQLFVNTLKFNTEKALSLHLQRFLYVILFIWIVIMLVWMFIW